MIYNLNNCGRTHELTITLFLFTNRSQTYDVLTPPKSTKVKEISYYNKKSLLLLIHSWNFFLLVI